MNHYYLLTDLKEAVTENSEEIKNQLKDLRKKFPDSFENMLGKGKIDEVIEEVALQNLKIESFILYFNADFALPIMSIFDEKEGEEWQNFMLHYKETQLSDYIEEFPFIV